MSKPYDIACSVFGHGLDLTLNPNLVTEISDLTKIYKGKPASFFERKLLPPGVCVVTAMRTGKSADVWGHVDKLFNAFKDPKNEAVLKNPGAPGNLAKLKALFPDDPDQEIHVSEGDFKHTVNFFDWTLFLSGANDPADVTKGYWVTKSGLYEYPIAREHEFTVARTNSPLEVKGTLVERIFDGSWFPTSAQINKDLGLSKVVGSTKLSELSDHIGKTYPYNSAELINHYQRVRAPGKRVVIYNFICRASPAEFLGREIMTRFETKLLQVVRATSSAQQAVYKGKGGYRKTRRGKKRNNKRRISRR